MHRYAYTISSETINVTVNITSCLHRRAVVIRIKGWLSFNYNRMFTVFTLTSSKLRLIKFTLFPPACKCALRTNARSSGGSSFRAGWRSKRLGVVLNTPPPPVDPGQSPGGESENKALWSCRVLTKEDVTVEYILMFWAYFYLKKKKSYLWGAPGAGSASMVDLKDPLPQSP